MRALPLLIGLSIWLSACGQSGDLYLPDEAPGEEQPAKKKDDAPQNPAEPEVAPAR